MHLKLVLVHVALVLVCVDVGDQRQNFIPSPHFSSIISVRHQGL